MKPLHLVKALRVYAEGGAVKSCAGFSGKDQRLVINCNRVDPSDVTKDKLASNESKPYPGGCHGLVFD